MNVIRKHKILSIVLVAAILLTTLAFTHTTVAETISDSVTISGGMVLSKTVDATDKPDVFRIKLGAYSTGEAYTIQKEVSRPVDIVMIIDSSGSMGYGSFSGASNRFEATQDAVNKFIDNIKADADAHKVNHRIAITTFSWSSSIDMYIGGTSYSSGNVEKGTATDYTSYVSADGKSNSSNYSLAQNMSLLEKVGGAYKPVTITRTGTMKHTYTYTFNDGTKVTSERDATVPTISKALYTYGTTTPLKAAFQDVTVPAQLQNLKRTIGTSDGKVDSAIEPDGTTYPSGAVALTDKIFDAHSADYGKDDNRAKLVIFFTDGMPGDDSSFNNTEGNKTIANFKSLKSKGVDVYSIGVFPDAKTGNVGQLPANSGNANKANRFMYLCSSYYPNASAMDSPGAIVSNYEEKPTYYMSPQNVSALTNTFTVISQAIHTEYTEVVLTEKAMIKDVITPYFAGPTSIDQIDYYYLKCTGIDPVDERLRTFSDTHIDTSDPGVPDLEVKILSYDENSGEDTELVGDLPNDTVVATNFDYKENWCGLDDGVARGYKVVVEFDVTVREGFLGGNGVPTNQAISGLYDDDGELISDLTLPMPEPKDVEIKDYSIEVNTKTKHVYLYNDLTEDQMLIGATIQMYNSEGEKDSLLLLDQPNYGLEQWRVDFINVTTESPQAPIKNVAADTSYNIKATVAPNIEEGACVPKDDTSDDTDVLCYVPRITFKDTSILSGSMSDYDNNLAKIEWVHKDKLTGEWKTSDEMLGEEPKLVFTCSPVEGVIYDDSHVKVTKVYIDNDGDGDGDTDITSYCLFEHEDCTVDGCAFNPSNENFIVHISDKSANLVINNTGDTVGENDTFVYTITSAADVNYKQTVVIKGKGSAVITGLNVATYTVTQDETWSYGYTCTTNPQTKTLVSEAAAGRNNVVTFENTKKSITLKEAWSYVKNLFKTSGIVATH